MAKQKHILPLTGMSYDEFSGQNLPREGARNLLMHPIGWLWVEQSCKETADTDSSSTYSFWGLPDLAADAPSPPTAVFWISLIQNVTK